MNFMSRELSKGRVLVVGRHVIGCWDSKFYTESQFAAGEWRKSFTQLYGVYRSKFVH
jgi:hypothetical protein